MNILLTGAGGPAGQALLSQLLELDRHQVIGVDISPVNHPALSHSEIVARADDPLMIEQLSDLIRRHDIDLLIPTVQEELPLIAAARSRLFPARVLVGKESAVRDAADKYLTMLVLDQAGVSVPRFSRPENHASVDTLRAAVGDHVIIKPRNGRGSRGVRELHLDAVGEQWDVDKHMIVQEFAPGKEYAPMVFMGAEPWAVVAAKRSDSDYRAVQVERVDAPDVAHLAIDAARALRLRGPVDVDVRRLADGRPVVLEVNARFGANSYLAPELLSSVLTHVEEHWEVP
ncbi:MAG: ATP-grasp domain-containing protein [Corynebacterium sp.]|uniref:ATP-grasp domain-containing protein n=1 Tax=Corynebacterium sp. TaxID=1720 RepID=UPI0026E11127|nr:ATP-grasp domain-containing protein [Corynebacterium sp.]MDO5670135.1 ATP-grasp domain-containing protein [Corynebacterium sp.]